MLEIQTPSVEEIKVVIDPLQILSFPERVIIGVALTSIVADATVVHPILFVTVTK